MDPLVRKFPNKIYPLRSMVLYFHKISPIINVVLAIACLSHISINAYNFLYPKNPSLTVYEKELGSIDFPVSFKICVREIKNKTKRYKDYGYKDVLKFFYGKSRGGYVGWNGEFKNGSSVHVKGTFIQF